MSSIVEIIGSWRIWASQNKLWKLLQAEVINEAAILACIDAHPEYCASCRKDKDNNDKYPIHMALDKGLSIDVIRRMLSCCPPDRMNRPLSGRTLLHDALRLVLPSEYAILIIDAYPGAARIQDLIRDLPLHVECGHLSRYDIIIKLLEIYPEAISVAGHYSSLPLYIAIPNTYSRPDVIFHLIHLYPDAVRVLGDYPLHRECMHQCRYEIIVKLLDIYPEAISICCNNNLPLHMALYNRNAQSDTIFHLVTLYPQAVSIMDSDERLPLHLALSNIRAKSDTVLHLISLYPQAVSITDGEERLPLHLALCNSNVQPDIVRHLITLYPQAASIMDNNNYNNEGRLPLHIISRDAAKFHIIPMLLAIYPDAVRIPDQENILPFPLIFYFYCKATSRYDDTHNYLSSKQYRDVVVEVLNIYPEVLDIYPLDEFKFNSPKRYRCLLNVVYRHISYEYVKDYHAMNWEARSPLLHFLLQLSPSSSTSASDSNDTTQQAQYHVSRIQAHGISNKMDVISYRMLAYMVAAAGKLICEEDGGGMIRYDMIKGDDLGCILLRNVILCL